MPTKTRARKLVDSDRILKRIQHRHKELRQLRQKEAAMRPLLWLDAYNWVTIEVNSKKQPSTTTAFELLARRCGTSVYTVNSWFYAGKLIADHRLDPDNVNGTAVMAARCAEKQMLKADWLKVLRQLKNGDRAGSVARNIRQSFKRSGHASVKRVRTAKESGEWNKKSMKLEAMVLLRVLQEYFSGEDGVKIEVSNAADEILLEVR